VYREHCTGKYLFRISDGLSTILIMVSGHIPRLHLTDEGKGKAIPVQAWRGPWDSKKLRLSEFVDNRHTAKIVGSTHLPPLPPRKYSWYSFLLEDESIPGPQYSRKDYVNEKSIDPIGNRTHDLPACSAVPPPTEPQCTPSPYQ
jgi:hypothetical protein